MGSFVNSRLDELPPHLGGVEGEALATGLGKAQDDELPLLRAAAVSDLPDLCPADALQGSHPVGEWFAIDRYPADTDDTYRARVSAAFATWRLAGTAVAVEQQIQAFGVQDVRVYPIDEMDFGPDPLAAYSEFWIVIGPDLGSYGGSADEVRALKRIVLKWKAAHGYPVEIIEIDSTVSILGFCSLGSAVLGGATSTRHRIGRTMNGTLPPLGDPGCILGGYDTI